MTENSILTIEQAAEFLGIGHIATLRKLARNCEIPAAKIGKVWRFIRVDLEEHLRSQYRSNKNESEPCHSTNVKIRPIGGSRSNSTADQYQKSRKGLSYTLLKNWADGNRRKWCRDTPICRPDILLSTSAA